MVGAGVWTYTVPLLCLWLFVIPIYLGVPAYVFRDVPEAVKSETLKRLSGRVGASLDVASQVVPYVRGAWIKPLRLSRFGVFAFFASVLLPVILTAAQIVGT
jgi:hypothetical protein